MKKILITGVAGMIGSHLLDRLLEKNNYMIFGVDNLTVGKPDNIRHNLKNKNFVFHKIDILNIGQLKKIGKKIDIIVHLAASKKISEKEPGVELLINNARSTENMLIIAKNNKSKFILGSTSDVYGLSDDLPFKEDGNLVLGSTKIKRWAYAVSKIYCEQLAFAYYKDYGVPVVVVRYFGGFSSRSSLTWRGGHVPLFIDAILNDKEITIHGNGRQTRSMAYVGDLVEGTMRAMENDKAIGEIINIGNDEELSVIDTAYLIKKLSGKQDVKIKFISYKNIFGDYKDIMRRLPDLTKAKHVLGYRPRISLREGLKRTIDCYREWAQRKK